VFREQPNVRKRPSGAGVKPGQACDEGKRPTLPTSNSTHVQSLKPPMPQTSNALQLPPPSNFQRPPTTNTLKFPTLSNSRFLQLPISPTSHSSNSLILQRPFPHTSDPFNIHFLELPDTHTNTHTHTYTYKICDCL